jgi:hypothetical protein
MTLPAMAPSSSDVGAVRGVDIGDQIESGENNELFEVPWLLSHDASTALRFGRAKTAGSPAVIFEGLWL